MTNLTSKFAAAKRRTPAARLNTRISDKELSIREQLDALTDDFGKGQYRQLHADLKAEQARQSTAYAAIQAELQAEYAKRLETLAEPYGEEAKNLRDLVEAEFASRAESVARGEEATEDVLVYATGQGTVRYDDGSEHVEQLTRFVVVLSPKGLGQGYHVIQQDLEDNAAHDIANETPVSRPETLAEAIREAKANLAGL